MNIIKCTVIMLCLIMFFSKCKKIDEIQLERKEVKKDLPLGAYQATILHFGNEEMLQAVLEGIGGSVGTNSNGDEIEFPMYNPPSVQNGILTFSSMEDYENYIEALDIISLNWIYDEVDIWEDTPEEIDHLGDFAYNAIDSALGFKSLRRHYELLEFEDTDYEDKLEIYIDDEELQCILNEENEVKIGEWYYKYVTSEIFSKMNSYSQLEMVRKFGYSTILMDNVIFFDEHTQQYITPTAQQTSNTCNKFRMELYPQTTPTPISNSNWQVNLRVLPLFDYNFFYMGDVSATGTFTVDWGDGTFQTYANQNVAAFNPSHTYSGNFAPGSSTNYNVTVTLQFITANPGMIERCPNITQDTYEKTTIITLANPVNCLSGLAKNKSYSQEASINGTLYRMKCKVKQRGNEAFLRAQSAYKASVSFQKKKNNKWKKTRPLHSLHVKIEGVIYNNDVSAECTSFLANLLESESTMRNKKIKVKQKYQETTSTLKSPPNHFNADFYFTYNNGSQSIQFNDVKLY